MGQTFREGREHHEDSDLHPETWSEENSKAGKKRKKQIHNIVIFEIMYWLKILHEQR